MDRPGFVVMKHAAREYGVRYETLRQMVKGGVFTATTFSAAKEQPRVYLMRSELELWKAGGVAAVMEARRKQPKRGK